MKAVAIGLVVFVLAAAFAGYWVLETDHPTKTVATPLFGYGESGTFTYLAHLKNNTLYNSSNLTPGNGTLFSAITDWVNVSFEFHLTANVPVNATCVASVAVILQSPAWSKPLFSETVSTTIVDGNSGSLSAVYDANVTNITSIASAIEKETGYVPSAYSVVISPTIRSSIGYGESSTGVSFFPSLTLNFTSNQIVPSHLTSSESGQVFPPNDPSPQGKTNVPIEAILLLLVALVGVGTTGYLTYESRGERRTPDLATITRPYQEAIVDARSPPSVPNLVPVRAWEDIVKAADTLGSPIVRVVRPTISGSEPASMTSFYVVSGTTAFVFVHSSDPSTAPPLPPLASASPPEESALPRHPSSVVRDWQVRYPQIPGVDRSNLDSFVAWSDRISDRLRWFRPSSALRQESEELLLRAIGLAQRGHLEAAWVILGQLYARVGPWDTTGKLPSSGPKAGTRPGPPAGPGPSKTPVAKR
jgi:uncharacterized protein DUF5305